MVCENVSKGLRYHEENIFQAYFFSPLLYWKETVKVGGVMHAQRSCATQRFLQCAKSTAVPKELVGSKK